MVQKRVSREIETKTTEVRRYALSEGFGLAYKIVTETSIEQRFDERKGVNIGPKNMFETVTVVRNENTHEGITPREYFRATRLTYGSEVPLRVGPVITHANEGLPAAVLEDLKTLPAIWELARLAKPQHCFVD
ncbi:MAG: hypothetical protein KKD18_06825 [Nanoarchaeota archaeon]|nr:hypothetical protein [Nanoarchaeota archaeon]MBU0978105.1 hypothetical protein [Nanoarchaeota archaeon]